MAKKKVSKKQKKPAAQKERKNNHFSLNGRFNLPDQTKRWIFGVLMFLVSLLIIMSFFGAAGAAGRIFIEGMTLFFGEAKLVLPFLFILGGVVFFSSDCENKSLVALAIFIVLLGVSGFFSSLDFSLGQGGWVGKMISWPFLTAFGELATKIIFLTIILIGGLIIFQLLYNSVEREEDEDDEEEKKSKKSFGEKPSIIKKIFAPKFKVKEVEPSGSVMEKLSPPLEVKEKPLQIEFKTKSIDPFARRGIYPLPPMDLLEKDHGIPSSGDIKVNSAIIKRTLQNFDIQVEMSEVNIGPTVTQYTLKPAEGVKLSKITNLSNDLALALATHPIRIEAPIPGRPLVGIELPNKARTAVRLRNLIEHPNFQNNPTRLNLILGRDVAGNPFFADLGRMPHLLVAGSTGTGKTICLNAIILSLLYKNTPDVLKLILIDPKRVEFSVYNELPHLLTPVIYDAQKTIAALKWLVGEMERRFEVFSQAKTRDIGVYNEQAGKDGTDPMPYIVLIIDELADLMAARGRDIEAGIVRLAQMARAVGIHLIVATQRPSVEVITGLIKANITGRITFQVASQVDSRTVLDTAGAEKLLGAGDSLFLSAEVAKPKRIQGVYASDKEVKKVMAWIKSNQERPETDEPELLTEVGKDGMENGQMAFGSLSQSLEKSMEEGGMDGFFMGEDPLFDEARRTVIEARKASASLLQRRLRIGYARAARLIDMLEERGVVGPGEGAKPREVYGEGGRPDGPEDDNQGYKPV